MINSTFDVGPAAVPTEKEPEAQFQINESVLRQKASKAANTHQALPQPRNPESWKSEWARTQAMIVQLLSDLEQGAAGQPARQNSETDKVSMAGLWLKENPSLLRGAVLEISGSERELNRVPCVRTGSREHPRVIALARNLLGALHDQWSEPGFRVYVEEFQKLQSLALRELFLFPPALKQAILEKLVPAANALIQGKATDEQIARVPCLMRSLQALSITGWRDLLEPLIVIDQILRRDPVYGRMDYASRDGYRRAVAKIAQRSELSEADISAAAVDLAAKAKAEPITQDRTHARKAHVGYYLIDEGREALLAHVGYSPWCIDRIRNLLKRHPDGFYIGSILAVSIVLVGIILIPGLSDNYPLLGLGLVFLLTLIPASQGAVELVNHLVTTLFNAVPLPKLDYSDGLPLEATTLVAVPALLLNEKQTRKLVNDIEVRYLGNRDNNLHFALLTDLPDSVDEPSESDAHPLVGLAAQLILDLNRKYPDFGSFLLLHRHRIFNPKQGVWMGWERKRGKLLDLNNLLRGQNDNFPVRAGDVSILAKVKYVLTLDSDTQLPHGAAAELVGAICHPLNRAIIDPVRRIVRAGYGILQPRVGVSVQSASRSRLAGLYSGQTGLDVYSNAVSDVYQDLYGEGIFTGKGLYEVNVLQQVLDCRFPRNFLLSHDLIEGFYARAGLVTDVEVIDDYPSHVSAYSRRKHRWVRGDWQIVRWLFGRVPDESGHLVPNPISIASRWKILDNLRRSLVEPATFTLFLAGWFGLPHGPVFWTLATMVLLFLPSFVQLLFSLIRAAFAESTSAVLVDGLERFYSSQAVGLFTLAFLPQQALLSIDAIVRTLVRSFVTRQRLLEWETAAEAESGNKLTAIDRYLNVVPAVSILIGLVLAWLFPHSFLVASPILLLWAFGPRLSLWLNRPPHEELVPISAKDELFLRDVLLRTWRYFTHFCNETNHWLIPDNVEEDNWQVAQRVSPTNLGLLFNSRDVALEAGHLTLVEYLDLTLRTLHSLDRMEKCHGHIKNWYNIITMEAFVPGLISSVDSGNLVASLWTLRMHCLELVDRPLLSNRLFRSATDHLRLLKQLRIITRKDAGTLHSTSFEGEEWIQTLLAFTKSLRSDAQSPDEAEKSSPSSFLTQAAARTPEDEYWIAATQKRFSAIAHLTGNYLPWLLPEFAPLRQIEGLNLSAPTARDLSPRNAPAFIDELNIALQHIFQLAEENSELHRLAQQLSNLLPKTRKNFIDLRENLQRLAVRTEQLTEATDFGCFLHRGRNLLSVALRDNRNKVDEACYDLFASEARTAAFVAVAKGDILPSTWFSMGRSHTLATGSPVLNSWTGTMFEYLMPALWMRTYSNTMLDASLRGAIAAQRAHASSLHIPWGISEAAYSSRDKDGHYQYHAFGIPPLALSPSADDGPIISPYSSFLAMPFDREAALANLGNLVNMGWIGEYGFYEGGDYRTSKNASHRKPEPVIIRSWMAHHQGITLLALANVLFDGAIHRWFHADPRVQACELLLHEKSLRPSAIIAIQNASNHCRHRKRDVALEAMSVTSLARLLTTAADSGSKWRQRTATKPDRGRRLSAPKKID
jgi:cyclic beta-1,2-glucan synthetase